MLAGDKPGDNAQCLSLAAALGWPTEVKQLRYLNLGRGLLRPFGELRFAVDSAGSSALVPPWPDLVIGCGRRSVPVAWAIRQRAGNATRLVQLGRPRANLAGFDLVVTSSQYQLPDQPNVLHLVLPLHTIDHEARALAAAEWAPRFATLPRPRIALLVGGTAKPFVLDVPAARRLAEQVNTLVRAEGGSILMSTSPRTPEACAQAICDSLDVPAYVHRWTPAGDPNPYPAYVALADGFVVTGDSASMLADACSTGRRVWFAELPTHLGLPSRARNFIRRRLLAPGGHGRSTTGPLGRLTSTIMARGWVRYPRDLGRLHAALMTTGRALPLGRTFLEPPPPPGGRSNSSPLASARSSSAPSSRGGPLLEIEGIRRS